MTRWAMRLVGDVSWLLAEGPGQSERTTSPLREHAQMRLRKGRKKSPEQSGLYPEFGRRTWVFLNRTHKVWSEAAGSSEADLSSPRGEGPGLPTAPQREGHVRAAGPVPGTAVPSTWSRTACRSRRPSTPPPQGLPVLTGVPCST